MKDRLQIILDLEHITAAQLADSLNVQRGGISHLLNGRNKPSFDFLEKLLDKYPELNAEWLITGHGKPFKTAALSSAAPGQDARHDIRSDSTECDLFSSQDSDSKTKTPATTPLTAAATLPTVTLQEKRPTRIIIYFSDGTYSEFYPFSVSSQPGLRNESY